MGKIHQLLPITEKIFSRKNYEGDSSGKEHWTNVHAME
jgi:hypothetical protein